MRSWFLLFACNLMWALQFTCIKLVEDHMGALFTVWGPMSLATLFLWPVIRHERRRNQDKPAPPKRRSDILLFAMLAILGVLPGQFLVTWGTRMSLASNAALINLTMPVVTAVLAAVLLGERMTPRRWLSFAVAIAGIALCSGAAASGADFGKNYLVGNLLIFLGTLGSAFYNSYGKSVLERYTAMEMLFFTYVAVLAVMTPAVFVFEPDSFARIPSFSAGAWLGFGLLTVFHNFLSMVLFLGALQKLDAIQAALCNYLITVFGVPIAALVLHEHIGALAWLGGGLVLVSTIAVTWDEGRQAARAAAAQAAAQAAVGTGGASGS